MKRRKIKAPDINEQRKRLAGLVAELRLERTWSQSHLAVAAGVSERTIQRLESRGIASAETLLSVAAALDVDVSLLSGSDRDSVLLRFFFKELQMSHGNRRLLGIISMLIALPAIYFVIVSVLDAYVGVHLLYQPMEWLLRTAPRVANDLIPVLFAISLAVSLAMNLYGFVGVKLTRGESGLAATANFAPRPINLISLSVSVVTIGAMSLYAIVENLT